jgi:hypothetical protein
MRYLLAVLSLLLVPLAPARADVDVGIGIAVPGVSIGINIPAYPRLVRVPGYPVYWDPSLNFNLFFYDGLYWVFVGDDWYVSDWYDGPWAVVPRVHVPYYLLRVPVRYYRRPPPYFHGWYRDRPPRWDEHWGRDWHKHRSDWDRRDYRPPPPAPLPYYQQHYSGKRYPHAPDERYMIRREHYRYQPRDPVSREHYQKSRGQGGQRDDDGRKGKR